MKVTKPDDIYAHCSQSQGIIYRVLFGWFGIYKSWGKRHTFSLEKQCKKMRSKLKLLCYPTKFAYITYLQYVTTVANI